MINENEHLQLVKGQSYVFYAYGNAWEEYTESWNGMNSIVTVTSEVLGGQDPSVYYMSPIRVVITANEVGQNRKLYTNYGATMTADGQSISGSGYHEVFFSVTDVPAAMVTVSFDLNGGSGIA